MADKKLTSLGEHTATNNNDLMYIVASNVSKFIRLSTLKNLFGEKNKDTYLDLGGVNQVTAAQVKDAVTKAHTQNTDLGTNSDNFTIGFDEFGDDIYLYFGEEGPGIRLNVSVSPNVLEWSNDGIIWQEFGTGSGGEWGTITGILSSQTDLQDALDLKFNKTGDTVEDGSGYTSDINPGYAVFTHLDGSVTTINGQNVDSLTFSSPPQTLTDGATINLNLVLGQNAKVTLGGNRTIANPSNALDGTEVTIQIIQDGTGGRTLTWSSDYKFPAGFDSTLNAGANEKTTFSFLVDGLTGFLNYKSGGKVQSTPTASSISNTPAGNIAATNVQAAINELDTEKEPAFSKNTAFNKDFGTGTTNIPEIGATLGNSQVVETNSSGKLITAAKGTAYNKDFGTTSNTVAEGSALSAKQDALTAAQIFSIKYNMFKNFT